MHAETILIAVIASFVIGFLLGRTTRSDDSFQKKPMRIDLLGPVPEDVESKIRWLIDRGHKIEALKELRQATGLGLKQAKDIIDSMATGRSLQEIISNGASSNEAKYSLPVRNSANAVGEVKNLLLKGKKIEALKLYQEASGLGLKEAKDEIDRMAKELG